MSRARRPPDPHFAVRPQLPDQLQDYTAEQPLTDDAVLTGVRLTDVDLSGTAAHLVDLAECRWERSSLADATLTKLGATDQELDDCDLALLTAPDASLTRLHLRGCRMSGLGLTGATLQQVQVDDGVADFSVWRFAQLTQVRFEQCRLAHADFTGAKLDRVVFWGCDLTEAEFHQVEVSSAWFIDCVLSAATGLAALRGATLAYSNDLDALALVPQLAAALGLRLADPAELAGP